MRICPPAPFLALVLSFAVTAQAAEDFPPLGRAVHTDNWSESQFFATPQVESLEWANVDFQPRWSGYLGAVVLQRARPESTLFVINPVTQRNIIDPANFDFPFQGGFDVGAIRYGSWADVEFRYFGVNDWDATQGPFDASDGFTLPIPGFDPANFPLTIVSWYASSLNSVELNLRRNILPGWSLLAGLRYISMRERMAFQVGDASLENGTTIGINANNDLYGLQIGCEGVLWQPAPRFRIESALKAGVYANGARSSIGANHFGAGGGGDPDVITWWGKDHTAFVGDLNFAAVYRFNDHLTLRGGYQLLWLSGVAVASEQIHKLNFAEGRASTDTSHGTFYHGALFGLEVGF